MKLGITISLFVMGCSGNIVSTTEANVENAARLTAASYRYQDASAPGAFLIKEAHCDVQAVIRDQKFKPLDAGVPCN